MPARHTETPLAKTTPANAAPLPAGWEVGPGTLAGFPALSLFCCPWAHKDKAVAAVFFPV